MDMDTHPQPPQPHLGPWRGAALPFPIIWEGSSGAAPNPGRSRWGSTAPWGRACGPKGGGAGTAEEANSPWGAG